MLCYVKQKTKKKGSRAVSAFSVKILHHHHSSLRHAQELQNWQQTCRYIWWVAHFLFGSIVSRRREIWLKPSIFNDFLRSGPEKWAIGSDFSATRYDLGKRRNTVSRNVLKFMLARLQRLGLSERRVLLSQRSDFAEKQHNFNHITRRLSIQKRVHSGMFPCHKWGDNTPWEMRDYGAWG